MYYRGSGEDGWVTRGLVRSGTGLVSESAVALVAVGSRVRAVHVGRAVLEVKAPARQQALLLVRVRVSVSGLVRVRARVWIRSTEGNSQAAF